jgi:WD40 repeat protein
MELKISLVQIFRNTNSPVWSVSWSPSGVLLASTGTDKTVHLWIKNLYRSTDISKNSIVEWQCCSILVEGHLRSVRYVTFSPSGYFIAAASFDSSVSLWKVSLRGYFENFTKLECHENEVKCVAWAPNNKYLATCGRDKTVWIWELMKGYEFEIVDVCSEHLHDVKCVSWHPKHNEMITCGYDDTIRVWRSDGKDKWVCSQVIQGLADGHHSTVWSVCFNIYGTRFASGGNDGTLKIWARESSYSSKTKSLKQCWNCSVSLETFHTKTIFSIDWSLKGIIISACGDFGVRIFIRDNENFNCQEKIDFLRLVTFLPNASDGDVNSVRLSSNNQTLAYAGDDGKVYIWTYKCRSIIAYTEKLGD